MIIIKDLIVITGPTASGKTGLSIEIAKAFDGEIVSADSMQIYKELSIATAKPDFSEMQGIVHHLIDVKSVTEDYSVAEYVDTAKQIILDIHQRNKLPIIVGGTGLYVDSLLNGYDLFATIIFVIASLTDLLDGKIARKYNLVTNFGKFMDPLADKLLVCSAMICLIQTGALDAWIVVIIIAREFIISGFRLIASDNGVVIAASYWGKFKTTFQMIMVIVLILNLPYKAFDILGTVLIYVSLALTIISLLDYVIKNKDVLKEQK